MEYYSDRDVELCAGTGERVDRFIEKMMDQFDEAYPERSFIRYELDPQEYCDQCYIEEDGYTIISGMPDDYFVLAEVVQSRLFPPVNDVVDLGFRGHYGGGAFFGVDFPATTSGVGYFENLVLGRNDPEFDGAGAAALFKSIAARDGVDGVRKLLIAGQQTTPDGFASVLGGELGMTLAEIEAGFDNKQLCSEKVVQCTGPMMKAREGGWSWSEQGGCTTSPAAVGLKGSAMGRLREYVSFTLNEPSSVRVRANYDTQVFPCTLPCEETWGRTWFAAGDDPDVWWDFPAGTYEVMVVLDDYDASSNVEVDVVPQ